MEWQTWNNDRCSGCGHPRSESMARENWDAYVADEVTCHACAARQRRADHVSESDNTIKQGLYFTVRKIDQSE